MYQVTYQAALETRRRIRRLCSFFSFGVGEDSSLQDLNFSSSSVPSGMHFRHTWKSETRGDTLRITKMYSLLLQNTHPEPKPQVTWKVGI